MIVAVEDVVVVIISLQKKVGHGTSLVFFFVQCLFSTFLYTAKKVYFIFSADTFFVPLCFPFSCKKKKLFWSRKKKRTHTHAFSLFGGGHIYKRREVWCCVRWWDHPWSSTIPCSCSTTTRQFWWGGVVAGEWAKIPVWLPPSLFFLPFY